MRDHLRLGISLVLAAGVVGGALYGLGLSLDAPQPSKTASTAGTDPRGGRPTQDLPSPGIASERRAQATQPGVIHVCEQGGRQTFSDSPCGPGMREVRQFRPKDSSGGLGGAVYAEQLARMPAAPAQAVPTPPSAVGHAAAPGYDPGRCKALFEQIRLIDAAARMPQGPVELDRLRADRKRLNDEVFALRCESLGLS